MVKHTCRCGILAVFTLASGCVHGTYRRLPPLLHPQAEYAVSSPDGRNKLTIMRYAAGVRYALARDFTEIISPTSISLTIDGRTHPGQAGVVDVARRIVDTSIVPVVPTIGSPLRDHHNEIRLAFASGVALRCRAYDDGVAFRWESAIDEPQITVDQEELTFRFSKNYAVYFPVPNGEGFFSHHESQFERRALSETSACKAGPVPALFELEGGEYLLISDVNVEGYPGLWLEGGDSSTIKSRFPHYPAETTLEGDRNQKVVSYTSHLAETVGRRSYPWRAFVLADSGGLLTSTMLYHLAETSRVKDPSWIKPGKVAWDWWNAWNLSGVPFRSGVNQETYEYYIDFAAEMGIPYVILDEGWSVPGPQNLLEVVPEIDMRALIAYGRSRQVGVILWMTSAALEANFGTAFAQFEAWDVAGLKIDFMQRDDQVMMDFLYRAAEEAARRRMIVDYHGGSKPAGITRTFPNVLTVESVLGLEQSKWCDKAGPEMAVLLPFIRMVVGPMDYTPGAMVNLQKDNFAPMFTRPASMGTRAHQLAMYVVYLSPLQMLADSPTHYRANPDCLAFLRSVPVTWDETRPLAAEVGSHLALTRRHGDTWYLAAMTDWSAREMSIQLDFLPPGEHEMTMWADGINADRYGDDLQVDRRLVTSATELEVRMAPGGGFAAIIEKNN